MMVGGAAILTLGSYFLADDHNSVFSRDLAVKRENEDDGLNDKEEATLDRALDESDADNDKLEEQVVQEATGREAD